jgi:hypothetical protein
MSKGGLLVRATIHAIHGCFVYYRTYLWKARNMAIAAERSAVMARCVSHVSDPSLRKLLQDQAIQQLYLPAEAPVSIPAGELEAFRDVILESIGGRPITHLEFGVAGRSLHAIDDDKVHPSGFEILRF